MGQKICTVFLVGRRQLGQREQRRQQGVVRPRGGRRRLGLTKASPFCESKKGAFFDDLQHLAPKDQEKHQVLRITEIVI